MKGYAMEHKTISGCDGRRDYVVCPKPSKLHLHPINHSEINDLKAGAELLDIILSKGSRVERSGNQVASSPPFFSGSPPSRVSNPQVQDEQFGSATYNMFSTVPTLPSSPSSATCKGGCVRMSFSQKPAAVRIEGFDCLGRDRQNHSIFGVA